MRFSRTSDIDVARQLLREHCGVEVSSASGEQPFLAIDDYDLGRLRLQRRTIRMELEGVVLPTSSVSVGRVRRGEIAYRIGSDEQVWHGGDVFLAARPGARLEVRMVDLDCDFATFDPSSLADLARAPGGRAVVDFRTPSAVSPDAAAQWGRVFDLVRELAEAPGSAPGGLVLRQATGLLAATTLTCFAADFEFEPEPPRSGAARPHTLQRAIDFIDANLDQDIVLMDIAAAAFVTSRAVQLTFRRYLATTPMRYLRDARLAQVHRALAEADAADGETVTAVSTRWGLTDQRRFARNYRDTFGELPSQTLQR